MNGAEKRSATKRVTPGQLGHQRLDASVRHGIVGSTRQEMGPPLGQKSVYDGRNLFLLRAGIMTLVVQLASRLYRSVALSGVPPLSFPVGFST